MPRLPIALVLAIISSFVFLGCERSKEAKKQGSNSNNLKGTRIAIDVGLVVSNMEESLAFYHDLLGLPIVAKIKTKLIGEGEMVQLGHGSSLIKLVEFEKMPASEGPKEISSALGLRYITLMVRNIDDIKLKMEKNNTTEKIPMTQLSNGAIIYMVEDPDGNIVEFVQEPID